MEEAVSRCLLLRSHKNQTEKCNLLRLEYEIAATLLLRSMGGGHKRTAGLRYCI